MAQRKGSINRPDLGQLAYEYMQTEETYIGLSIMPIFESAKQAHTYPIIKKEELLRVQDTRRAPRSGYARDDFEFDEGSFFCQEHGFEAPVDDVEAELYADYMDIEEVSTEMAMDKMLRAQEKRIADITMKTSNAGSTSAAAVDWEDLAAATPKADIDKAMAVQRMQGVKANALVLGWQAFKNLSNCDEVKKYLQYTNPHLLNAEQVQASILATYLGINEILIGDAIYNKANKAKDADIDDLWPSTKAALIKVSGGGPRLKEPVFGRTFLWTADSPTNLITETYREEHNRGDIVRVRNYVGERIIFKAAMHHITGIGS